MTNFNNKQNDIDDCYLQVQDVAKYFGGIHRTTVYRMVKRDSSFPKPIHVLNKRMWKASEIKQWAERQKEAA